MGLSNYQLARKIKADMSAREIAVAEDAARVWTGALEELEHEYAYYLSKLVGEDGTVNLGVYAKMKRIEGLERDAEKILEHFVGQVDGITKKGIRDIATRHLEKYNDSMTYILPNELGRAFTGAWPQVVTSILNRKVEGVHFSNRLGEIPEDVAGKIMDQLAIGAAKGESIPGMMKRLRDASGMGKYRAELIARTEVIRASNDAATWTYAQYSNVITAKRRMATFDKRTCPACLALDGKEYRLDEPMDDHPVGRCSFVAVTPSWKELGYDVEDPLRMRRARDPYSGQNELVKHATARDWFGSLDESMQKSILGPDRWRMLKDGRISWEDIAGKGSTVTPLYKLKGGAGPVRKTTTPAPKRTATPKAAPAAKTGGFVAAATQDEVNQRFGKYVKNYGLADQPLDIQNRILQQMEEVFGKYNVQLEMLTYQKSGQKSYGRCVHYPITGRQDVQFQKGYLKNAKAKVAEGIKEFASQKKSKIEYFERCVKDPARSSILDYNKNKLDHWERTPFWAVFHEADDPIAAVARHEFYHAVDNRYGLRDMLKDELTKAGYADYLISEYGSTKRPEFFAELASGIDLIPDKIPAGVRKVFEEVMTHAV
jgi:SPP1 gp7 family putative phage head morphogenesis protein